MDSVHRLCPIILVACHQVGYLEDDVKVAVWISKGNNSISEFQVMDMATQKVVFTGSTVDIRDTGKQPAFESSARLNSTILKTPGTYTLKAGETKSVPFRIGNNVYTGAADIPLKYSVNNDAGTIPSS